jgi:hypothetical protein
MYDAEDTPHPLSDQPPTALTPDPGRLGVWPLSSRFPAAFQTG